MALCQLKNYYLLYSLYYKFGISSRVEVEIICPLGKKVLFSDYAGGSVRKRHGRVVGGQGDRYNEIMLIERLHEWNVTVDRAIEIQRDLAGKIIQFGSIVSPRLILGLDVSIRNRNEATAAAVVLTYPELKIVEKAFETGKVDFPYIPGLLSFREMPITLRTCEKLKANPDLVLVDGQGIAHPRRLGLASHLGLFLNRPAIGCAKSHLYGNYEEPPVMRGSHTDIIDNDAKVIGSVLRTKSGVKPLFISIGHMICLSSAIQCVLQCCQGFRLPEPARLAHLTSKGSLDKITPNKRI